MGYCINPCLQLLKPLDTNKKAAATVVVTQVASLVLSS